MTPLNVTIVRPKIALATRLLTSAFLVVIGALVVTWLAPIATGGGWRPGFIQSAAIYVLAGALFRGGNYIWWTKEAAR